MLPGELRAILSAKDNHRRFDRDRVAEMNEALASATMIRRIEFRTCLSSGRCDVLIELVDDRPAPKVSVNITANDVMSWSVDDIGGGVSQLQCLQVTDVSDSQHDRVRYILEDLEHQRSYLRCAALSVHRAIEE